MWSRFRDFRVASEHRSVEFLGWHVSGARTHGNEQGNTLSTKPRRCSDGEGIQVRDSAGCGRSGALRSGLSRMPQRIRLEKFH